MTTGVVERVRLDVDGMSCAACAARIERKLRRLDGVAECAVNYATEEATVAFDTSVLDATTLIRAVEAAGYHAALPGDAAAEARPARPWRLAAAAALTAPVAVLAMIPGARFGGWEWLALALTTPVVAVGGWPFHRTAVQALRRGEATMDTLVSLGTLAAWGWSTVVLLARLDAETYFEVAAVITTVILLGRFLENRAKRSAGDAIRRLLELAPAEASLLRDGTETRVAAAELSVGDRFVVRPGERVATDGVVVDGESAVDASLLTGESAPIDVAVGDAVAGATVNTSGRLVVEATRVGADTAIARIARLVAEAQSGKAPIQRVADRVAGVFVPAVVAVALGTLAVWLALAPGGRALEAAVAVLIVACPCALGLATPTALLVGTGRGAQLGVLIASPAVLERTRAATTIVLDKTGTVTEGRLRLVTVEPLDGTARAEALRLAGAVEDGSEHPVGRAIAAAARAELGSLPAVSSFRSTPGHGVEGMVEGHVVAVGRSDRGVAVSWDGAERALLTLEDAIKPTSRAAIAALRDLGLEPVLLTGDAEAEARRVAAEVGIDRVVAGVLPDGKLDEIRRLQSSGAVVAMAGDGVNDAPALAQADLGIAMGSGADVAIEASDVTVASSDLAAVVDAVRLSRATLGTIRGNLFWAFAYNVAAIPVAAAGLLDPMIAAAAMAGSSLFVVGNSLRLRRFRSVRT